MAQGDRAGATTGFVPAPGTAPPAGATGEITVAAPPELPPRTRSRLLSRLVPLLTSAVVLVMMTVLVRRGPASAHDPMVHPMLYALPVTILVSAAATYASGHERRRGHEIDCDRADYLSYLSGLRAAVAQTAAAQRRWLAWRHPEPGTLWTLIGSRRMWERRPADQDFCQVRVGVGIREAATRLVPPKPAGRADPVTEAALRRFIGTYSTIADAPITVALTGLAVVTVDGDPARVRGLLRAMLCQLAVLHPPDLLLIAGVVSDTTRRYWDWLKWLPHNRHPTLTDAIGAARMVYSSVGEAQNRLAGLAPPHVVVVVDGGDRLGGHPIAGFTTLVAGDGAHARAAAGGVRLHVTAENLVIRYGADNRQVCARPDRLHMVEAVECARRLGGYHVLNSTGSLARSSDSPWPDLLGISDVTAFDPIALWRSRNHRDRLRVPIGITEAGAPLELDIKEAAEHGTGPHGLCIGATGSGKSEFLRTVALGMMARHPTDVLNLVLVDFKGGATFLHLEQAPHVAAVITNLSDEAQLVVRMQDALAGEMYRRQQLLRAAGNYVSCAAYEQARRAGTRLPALPALFIIVDEFSELLSQHPDFADLFVAIGRQGRSLGMHLLLASQRLDEGRLRGLESHLSYRVCLKTLSANESRLALGTADAFQLPNTPGAGVLRTATGELIRFQTAFVSGPCPKPTAVSASSGAPAAPSVRLFGVTPAGPVTGTAAAPDDQQTPRTVLQAVVDRLAGCAPRAHEVWLAPLGSAPALDTVLRAATPADVAPARLAVPIGIVDRPFEQRRTPLMVDLSGAAGNVAVVGAPRSGKSTAVRTLITALCVTHSPDQVQFYCLDFGGGALGSVCALPHVGSVAGRAEPQRVTRTIAELESIVRSREVFFRDHGISSITQYRGLQSAAGTARPADIFLVIDGWAGLCREFDRLEPAVTALAAQGLSFGVHVVLTASRWAEIRSGLKDQIGTRIELRLGDPADSEMDRKRACHVPAGCPGRGLSPEGLHMVVALPRLDGLDSTAGLSEASVEVAEELRRRHGRSVAPPIPLLPTQVDHAVVVDRAGDRLRTQILIGLEDRQLQPVPVDFDQHEHMLILGDNRCGKTSALRTLCREIVRTTTPAQAQLFVVDARRSLLGVVESEHLGGYAISVTALRALLPEVLELLQRRMPPPRVTQAQLRARSWWSGPEVYVIVDDYDLVATAAGNPLTPISEYLPYARDLGLHLVIARRSGGAAHGLFEPLLAALRDSGCLALLMSGHPEEGPVIGSARFAPLPPGRGILVAGHGDEQLVQVGWSPPP
ncbi:type VII secretion protein EccCa [Mycobacterium botniense]|uniref:Type VII secretion protein EccC n=1 Tax=Mycobacterium botniense TaxID=84962 RepID=A0A7I9XSX1_9MYCO|nr:type VII secretion protein EccCa [Mycobacterium botniense]GFG73054.1 type VII secretion protein EccC [Mycobacterium botniense]